MSIASVRDDANKIGQFPLEDQPFFAASIGEALERELSDPANLVKVGEEVVRVAHDRGYTALAGASTLGERLVAAAVALSNNGLRLRQPADGDPVMIVDGILVTGAQIFDAARRLRADGASKACAVVVVATQELDLSAIVDELVILDS